MRLIDADELVKRFSNSKCGKILKTMVDTQPTAYDVDEVVKELKKEAVYFDIETDLQYLFLDEAIEIVKRGGR